jgi:hypothetical protein
MIGNPGISLAHRLDRTALYFDDAEIIMVLSPGRFIADTIVRAFNPGDLGTDPRSIQSASAVPELNRQMAETHKYRKTLQSNASATTALRQLDGDRLDYVASDANHVSLGTHQGSDHLALWDFDRSFQIQNATVQIPTKEEDVRYNVEYVYVMGNLVLGHRIQWTAGRRPAPFNESLGFCNFRKYLRQWTRDCRRFDFG